VHILLAIDASESSRKAVWFVGQTVSRRQAQGGDLKVTLFHVVESLPDFIISRIPNQDELRRMGDDWFQTSRDAGQALLERQKQVLIDAGVPAAAIDVKLEIRPALPESRKVVAALAVIEEMQAGPYDVVCVGRRADAEYAGSIFGSVAEKVLREARGKTVWVVD
jgi:nucleotide-binding universal stress UspA family protein